MALIELQVDAGEPIAVVWDALADLSSHVDWMADAESIEFVGDQRDGVGTVMRVLTTVGPLRTTDVMIVTEWVERDRIVVKHTGTVSGVGAFKLVETPDGTRLDWSEDLQFPWYLGGEAAAKAASPVLRRIWRANLDRFVRSLGSPDHDGF